MITTSSNLIAGNTIVLNGNDGVLITAAGTTANLVEGNFIGTDSTGTKVEGNKANGVEIATAANTNTVGGTTAAAGNLIANNTLNGVLITTSSNLVAGNTIVLNGNDGVLITAAGTTANLVEGNFIGTDSTGTKVEGNKANGVEIAAGANTNTVGGTTAAAGNLIANNTLNGVLITTSSNLIAGNTIVLNGNDGVLITAAGTTANLVEGNFIGTDSTGTKVEGNKANGIEIAAGANTNTGGGTTAAAGNRIANHTLTGGLITTSSNLIAGNTIVLNGNDGVLITAAGTTANLVEGNFIGTDSTGTKVEGNKANGVEIAAGADTNTVGGTTAAAGNLIANNTVNGVLITTSSNLVAGNTIVLNGNDGVLITAAGATANLVEGNFIGTDSTGTKVEGNKANGVEIAAGANTNTVGGTTAAAANLIANNAVNGVLITTSSNLVAGNTIVLNGNDGVLVTAAGTTANLVDGNFIGTDSTGTKVEGNKANGVEIAAGANTNMVGGTTAAAANLIANNMLNGVLITTSGNLVAGNTILSNGTNGVEIASGASTNTVGGTAVGAGNTIALNGNDGVLITAAGTTANLVEGDFIGTNLAGATGLGNLVNGVALAGGASLNTIGGTTAAARNVVSDNGNDGVLITSAGTTGNLVEGNYIGTDPTGAIALGNKANGIEFTGAAGGNTIGGTAAGAGNVISANLANGILVTGTTTPVNLVQGNFIGTTADGLHALGNTEDGVQLSNASNYTIGGTAAGAGNVISGNSGNGIQVLDGATATVIVGNLIGTDKTGATALGNGQAGVYLNNVGGNTVGGTTAAVRNVISGNIGDGVLISGSLATTNLVEGNYIWLNVAGNVAVPNQVGVQIDAGANGNRIGAGNVISGNIGDGVLISGSLATSNLVEGNTIGLDVAGDAAVPNQVGVQIDAGANGNTIGAGNVISGNLGDGVLITDASNNTVTGNTIGLDASGNLLAGAAQMDGVEIVSMAGTAAGNQIVGGTVIGGNTNDGVLLSGSRVTRNLVSGIYIGLSPTSAPKPNQGNGVEITGGANGNTIGGGNFISGNVSNGVLISGAATTANVVAGNTIGLNVAGTAPLPNQDGVQIAAGASGNTIGSGNFISGNTSNGVLITNASNNTVTNNTIGLNAGGNVTAPAQVNGVAIVSMGGITSGNQIAGGNVIGGNANDGVILSGTGTTTNTIAGNDIGIDASGNAKPNQGNGVVIAAGASSNTISGLNIISGNTANGVQITDPGTTGNVVEGDYIGVNATGNAAVANQGNGVVIQSGAGNQYHRRRQYHLGQRQHDGGDGDRQRRADHRRRHDGQCG